uniref:Secreted protein n=1 Tax=Solanum tuberosum TaxID=4113 RepID=M1CS46_SOLTU
MGPQKIIAFWSSKSFIFCLFLWLTDPFCGAQSGFEAVHGRVQFFDVFVHFCPLLVSHLKISTKCKIT